MIAIQVLCVGKLKEKFYTDASAEYAKRLSAFCRPTVTGLPEERPPANPPRAQIDAALAREGEAVAARIPRGGAVIALCVEGTPMSSEALSAKLEQWAAAGRSSLTFLIGGSYGMSPALKSRADLRLSMSPMTFPHHLARVMLLEQIYRAFKISEGSGYHK